jgi:hypothetical protein
MGFFLQFWQPGWQITFPGIWCANLLVFQRDPKKQFFYPDIHQGKPAETLLFTFQLNQLP